MTARDSGTTRGAGRHHDGLGGRAGVAVPPATTDDPTSMMTTSTAAGPTFLTVVAAATAGAAVLPVVAGATTRATGPAVTADGRSGDSGDGRPTGSGRRDDDCSNRTGHSDHEDPLTSTTITNTR